MLQRALLQDHVKLKAHELGKNYKDVLVSKLRLAYEGKCTRHGYIVPNTVEFSNCSLGKLDGASLNGDVTYTVEYYANVCNPAAGTVVAAKVVNINRFGILAQGGMVQVTDAEEEESLHNVLDIIIAKQGLSMVTDVDLDRIRIGDMVSVQILGKRFELNDTKISVVGKVIAHEKALTPVMAAASSSGVYDAAASDMEAADGDDDSDASGDGEGDDDDEDSQDDDEKEEDDDDDGDNDEDEEDDDNEVEDEDDDDEDTNADEEEVEGDEEDDDVAFSDDAASASDDGAASDAPSD
jgi:DNA-directed RNA polymerase subunit E'/Rpb7